MVPQGEKEQRAKGGQWLAKIFKGIYRQVSHWKK